MSAKPLNPRKSRNANYKLLDIASKFTPIADQERANGTCANLKQLIEPVPYEKTMGYKVSAPYVLSRLCALFTGLHIDVGGQRDYKTTWNVILEHKSSGIIVTFYDYKGSISYGSNLDMSQPNTQFIRDMQKLIKTLKDHRCPHPYDGCVVGEVA